MDEKLRGYSLTFSPFFAPLSKIKKWLKMDEE
jgi:hypothetical protein